MANFGESLPWSIQELPQQNIAKVDCVVERMEWKGQYTGKKRYQGPAIAIFTHYTDGRGH